MYKFFKNGWNFPKRLTLLFIRQIIKKYGYYSIPVSRAESAMSQVGLNRDRGLERLNLVLAEIFNKKYNENDGMFSEHLILIAAISVDYKINKVLEIGTYDGRTAIILGKLFPDSQITTIDLPSSEETFTDFYDRKNKLDMFIKEREENLNKVKNVNFIEMNSAALINQESKYDLIWIDGAHGYPVVAMDVINAYRIANDGAFILLDDVWIDVDKSDSMYKSVGGFTSLKTLVEAKLIREFNIFHKRLSGIYNYTGERKYIGFFRKNKD